LVVLQRVPKLLRTWNRRSIRDAAAIAGLCFLTYIAAASFDIFGQTYEFVKRYEAYELDELIVVAVAFGFLMVIYALRRVQDLQRETLKRRGVERTSANHAVRLTTAINNMLQGLLMFDSANRLVVCNERYLQMHGLSPEIVKPGVTLLQLIKHRKECGSLNGDPDQYYARLLNDIAMGQPTRRSIETPDGRTIQIVTLPMVDGGWVSTHEDTTDKLRAKDLIEKQEFQLSAALENMSQGLCMFDAAQRLIVCNKRYADLYGLNEEQTRPATTLREILQYRIATGHAPDDHESYINDRINEVSLNKPYQITNRLRNGRYVSVVHRPMAGGGWVATHEDVTEWMEAEQRIAHMAHSDSLTDLPNRAAFNECLASWLRLAQAKGGSLAVLCMDLDRFKQVNDVYGHTVGDLLLCRVADRLRAVADGVFIARLGGDEFTIIANIEGRPSVAKLTDRLLAAFVDDFEVDGHRLRQNLSIGVTTYPADGTDAETLTKNADAALYRAKAEDPGSVRFFEAEMAVRLRERAALQADLKRAIEHNELRLHYQPQLKITGEITGFEALARWQSPKRGMVPPGEFIPIAEESSLILRIGEWVLREACREAVSWKKPLRVAVNVSPIQFRHGDLPRLVHSVLLETGLAPNRLELEITEGVLIDDFSRAVSILRRLKSLGTQIALDDFGTGYSSLSYLHSFPFDKIKIDRAFISDLEKNRHSIAIVRAVIGLGQSLDIPILAEGVETQAQHALLAQEGCDEVQGYLTGRPLAIADYADVVGRKRIVTAYSPAI
jgi:diguanylate cyclase (GGDEF)-like protein